MKKCCIVDTTLRDGEQRPGSEWDYKQKIRAACVLDQCGIPIIEGGIPAIGKTEQQAVYAMKNQCRKALIGTWNRIQKQDINASLVCEPDIIHLSVPVSIRQIYQKLGKNEDWTEKQAVWCAEYVQARGYTMTIGFEDASSADMDFMVRLAKRLARYSVLFFRFADTLGKLVPHQTCTYIKQLHEQAAVPVGFHGHNDLGMVIANSLSAIQGGASFIDTTILGIGERTGNCPLGKFMQSAGETFSFSQAIDSIKAERECREILHIDL